MVTEKTEDAEVQTDGFLAMLPYIRGRYQEYPLDMIGATIVRFGTFPESDLYGNDLVVEYLPLDSSDTKRLAFSFSDQGMWISSSSSLGLRSDGSGVSSANVFAENMASHSG